MGLEWVWGLLQPGFVRWAVSPLLHKTTVRNYNRDVTSSTLPPKYNGFSAPVCLLSTEFVSSLGNPANKQTYYLTNVDKNITLLVEIITWKYSARRKVAIKSGPFKELCVGLIQNILHPSYPFTSRESGTIYLRWPYTLVLLHCITKSRCDAAAA